MHTSSRKTMPRRARDSRRGDADRLGQPVEHPWEQAQGHHHEADGEPEDGVLLAQLRAAQQFEDDAEEQQSR
jgi:hypothetical protein